MKSKMVVVILGSIGCLMALAGLIFSQGHVSLSYDKVVDTSHRTVSIDKVLVNKTFIQKNFIKNSSITDSDQ